MAAHSATAVWADTALNRAKKSALAGPNRRRRPCRDLSDCVPGSGSLRESAVHDATPISLAPTAFAYLHRIETPQPMQSLLIHLIAFYQRWLSPLLGRRCRFHPSCSHYSSTAIERFGWFRGSLLGAARIARCQPFCSGGFDAVPDRFPRVFWRRNTTPPAPLPPVEPQPRTPSAPDQRPSP